MTEFVGAMDHLLGLFGEEMTHYEHQGEQFEDPNEKFWPEDSGHETDGTTYTVAIEESISDKTLNQPGFSDEADMAVWLDSDVCSEGDKLEYQNRELIVISVSNMRAGGTFARQLVGVRSNQR